MTRFTRPLCDCDPVCAFWKRVEVAERQYERSHDAWLQARFEYMRHLDNLAAEAAA